VADLEELALKRDRGYLVRLVAMLILGVGAALYVWRGLTSDSTSGCLANAFLGQSPPAAAPPADAPKSP
jgi:hypothetical protein